jgi:hypothetical protein
MVFRLNGKEICNSKAAYKGAIVSSEKPMAAGHEHSGGMLSGMTECPMYTDVKKGDKISLEAFYDLDQHPS